MRVFVFILEVNDENVGIGKMWCKRKKSLYSIVQLQFCNFLFCIKKYLIKLN